MGSGCIRQGLEKIRPYTIRKGWLYLRHFGVRRFASKVMERMAPEEVPYGPWYEHYRPTQRELNAQKRRRWPHPVTFSILVPLYRTDPFYLREMITSVQEQTYPYWELCLVSGGALTPPMKQVLRAAKVHPEQEEDGEAFRAGACRLRILKENRGIAGNTNEALRMSRGRFVCLLDHDDRLSPAALFQVARYLQKHPLTDMIYTDEDKISGQPPYRHHTPNLKPDFNLDLLRSNNYICHMLTLRRTLMAEAGGEREGFDGAADHDLILRCCELTDQIGHVPEILYHWRTSEQSTADNPLSKMQAYDSGRRAIDEHLARTGTPGQTEQLDEPGFYRVHYAVRREEPVSILIPSRDHADVLRSCLESVYEKTTYTGYEILVIENNSQEEATFDYYRQIDGKNDTRVITWEGEGFNYSALNNFGEHYARGSKLIFLNNDIRVITPGWIEELLSVCQREEVGAAGARLYYPDDRIQHAGIVIGMGGEGGVAGSMFVDMKRSFNGYMNKAVLLQDMSAVTAACMMVDRKLFNQLGGFDEQLSVAFNDVDLCLRIGQSGRLVVYDPYVEMYHDESRSRGAEDDPQKVRRFQEEIERMRTRWETILRDGDPYYNKNLSLTKWNYTLREKERMR